MAKKKGLVKELVCDIEAPLLKYQIDRKEYEIIRDKAHVKFWERGLRRKTFSKRLKEQLKDELKDYRQELREDKEDLERLRSKLRKCM